MSFHHTHSEETYDEYKTEDKNHRITVVYENGHFQLLQLRAYRVDQENPAANQFNELTYTSVDEINQLINALHAAVAGINKRSI